MNQVIAAVFAITAASSAFLVVPANVQQRQQASVATPSAKSLSARVDELFAKWNRPDSPGCSVGVSRNGSPVYERGYGMANLEAGTAITPASVFHVASISKQGDSLRGLR